MGRLRWLAIPEVSCLHAADAVRRGLPLTDRTLADRLGELVREADEALTAVGVEPHEFYQAAIPLSARIPDRARQVEAALAAASGGEQREPKATQRVARCLAAIERAVHTHWPRLAVDVRLRERPLREQWDERGPGLLRRLATLTGAMNPIPDADVALVHPVSGGGAEAHPNFQFVRLEAVLTNPWSALPEPVRLGWLLAQLVDESDNPLAQATRKRKRLIQALATLPLVLEAAEYVEWARSDRETLLLAIDAWRPPTPRGFQAVDLATLLETWRRDCNERGPSWAVALAALDQRIPS